MADLLIVQPNTKHTAYPGMGTLPAVEPPLWARLIAGYCRDRGWRVRILDLETIATANNEVMHPLGHGIKLAVVMATGHQPSASTQAMPAVRQVCASIKANNPELPILLVGGHVAALPERTLREEPCDYVCTGEGPATVDGLLHALCTDAESDVSGPYDEVPGLARMVNGMNYDGVMEYHANAATPLLDVSHLHGDAWDLLPMERYRAHNWHCDDGRARTGYASIYTSLGCPYSCSFCCINAPFGKPSYRMRNPVDVVGEIRELHHRYGVTNFKITDEMFVLNAKHVRTICEALWPVNDTLGSALNIWAYARVDTAAKNADLLPLMRAAGIRWLALGIESADDAVMDGADKSFRKADAAEVARTIQAAGIKVIGNFIFGLPGDTLESMERTYALAVSLRCDAVNFYSAMAYPGSQLYREHEVMTEMLPPSWSGYAQHAYDCHPLPTETMTSAQVLEFRDEAQRRYHAESLPVQALRLPRKLLGSAGT